MHFDLLHTDYETSQGLGRIFKFIESTHEIPTMIGLSLRWKSDATLAYSFTGEFGIGSRATFKPRYFCCGFITNLNYLTITL